MVCMHKRYIFGVFSIASEHILQGGHIDDRHDCRSAEQCVQWRREVLTTVEKRGSTSSRTKPCPNQEKSRERSMAQPMAMVQKRLSRM